MSEREVDGDLRLHLDRFAVQDVGTESPLADRVERGWRQHGMTADESEPLDVAVARDDGGEDDGTLDVCAARDWRIACLHTHEDVRWLNARDAKQRMRLGRGRLRRNRRPAAEHA